MKVLASEQQAPDKSNESLEKAAALISTSQSYIASVSFAGTYVNTVGMTTDDLNLDDFDVLGDIYFDTDGFITLSADQTIDFMTAVEQAVAHVTEYKLYEPGITFGGSYVSEAPFNSDSHVNSNFINVGDTIRTLDGFVTLYDSRSD